MTKMNDIGFERFEGDFLADVSTAFSEIQQLTGSYKEHRTKFHLYDMSDHFLKEKEKQKNDKRTTGQNI